MTLPPFFDSVVTSVRLQPGARRIDPGAVRTAAERFRPAIRVGSAPAAGVRAGARLLTELLARTFSEVSLDIADPQLAQQLGSIARQINPGVRLREGGATLTFAWGTEAPQGEVIWCGGDRWTAVVSRSGPAGFPESHPALAAACLGFGEGFKIAFAEVLPEGWERTAEFHLSLLDYSTSTTHPDAPPLGAQLDIGRVFLVGAGAIGSAFAFALAHGRGLRGRILAIDNQKIDLGNLQRYAGTTMASIRSRKVDHIVDVLGRPDLVVKPYDDTWEEFIASWRDAWRFERMVVGVDDAAVRRRIAAALPREVLNGGTGSSVVSIGRYGFDGVRECLHCAYLHVPAPTLFDVLVQELGLPLDRIQQLEDENRPLEPADARIVQRKLGLDDATAGRLVGKVPRTAYAALCGQISVGAHREMEGAVVPVAHAPALAGVLLAVELLKAASPAHQDARLDHVFELDLRHALDATFRAAQVQQRSSPCVCADTDYSAAFKEKWPALR